MKIIIALVAAVMPMVLSYDEKFDKVDIDKILADDVLLGKYVNCWLEKGPCDMEYAEEYKKMMPEVVATACGKCTPIQRQNIRKTVKAIAIKKPNEILAFRNKFDPEHKYEAALAAFLMASD